MRDAADHAGGDPARPHCRSCVKDDGSVVSFEEVAARMAAHLEKTMDLHPAAARAIAEERLSQLPAWANETRSR